MGNALMNTTNRIDAELTKRVEAVREKYQRQLTENFEALKRLAEANQKFQAMLDSFFNSAEMFDYMIQNENAYEAVEQEEDWKKELRAEGMRRQQEEKLAMEHRKGRGRTGQTAGRRAGTDRGRAAGSGVLKERMKGYEILEHYLKEKRKKKRKR